MGPPATAFQCRQSFPCSFLFPFLTPQSLFSQLVLNVFLREGLLRAVNPPQLEPSTTLLPGRSTASELAIQGTMPRASWGTGHGLCLSSTERHGHCVFNWEFFLNKVFEILLQPFPFFLRPPCLACALFHSTSCVQQRSSQRWKVKICSCTCDRPFQPHHVRQHRHTPPE